MIERYADLLEGAVQRRVRVPAFAGADGVDLDAAYDIQRELVRRRTAVGAVPVGWKLSGLSSGALARLGVDAPVMGQLVSDDLVGNGGRLDPGGFIEAMLEVEIALVFGCDIEPDLVRVPDLQRCVAGVAPAFDIADSRIEGPGVVAGDVVADRAAAGAFVLGPITPVDDAGDLSLLGVAVDLGGEVVASGAGAMVMGHPIVALSRALSARTLPARLVRRGDVVTTGSLIERIPLPAGGSVHASFARLGSVDLRLG